MVELAATIYVYGNVIAVLFLVGFLILCAIVGMLDSLERDARSRRQRREYERKNEYPNENPISRQRRLEHEAYLDWRRTHREAHEFEDPFMDAIHRWGEIIGSRLRSRGSSGATTRRC